MIIDQTHIYAYQNLTMIYQLEYVETQPSKYLENQNVSKS